MIPTKEELQKALEQRYGAALCRRIAEAAVAVCGLGGLGSHIAMALARAGVGRDCLKAVLTPHNRGWNAVKLYGELRREHQAMNGR